MSVQIDMRVDGKPGEISLDAFAQALTGLHELVASVSKTISDSRHMTVRAFVTDLRLGSLAATVQLRAEPSAKRADPDRTALTVVQGLGELQERDSLPAGFSLSSLDKSARLAGAVRGGARAVELKLVSDSRAKPLDNAPPPARVTVELAEHLRRARQGVVEAEGGLYGTVDMLSARGRAPWFGLRDEVGRTAVRCQASRQVFAQAQRHFMERVYVHGIVSYNRRDQPTSIAVTELEGLVSDRHEVHVADIIGTAPRITGGLSPVEYVRRMRDAED